MGPDTLAEQTLPPSFKPRPRPERMRALPQMTRGYLWVCALGCAGAAVLLATLSHGQPAGPMCAGLYMALALASLAAARVNAAQLPVALAVVLSAVTVTLGASSVWLGWGLSAPALAITGLMICVLCTAGGGGMGAVLAAIATATVLAVALFSPGASVAAGTMSPWLPLGAQLMAIASGLAAGLMVSQVLQRFVRAAVEREQRFRRLLALGTDAYWEIDRHYRLVAAAGGDGERRLLTPAEGFGRLAWELPQFGCDADTLDLLQASLDERRAFRDLLVHWVGTDGTRTYLVSGEPRFDARGVFTGCWGVARDITAMQSARDALAATETRYQELFARIPTPLVLHRDGVVLDANPAALTLFGHDDMPSMLGSDVLATYEGGDSRERARRRMEQLQGAAPGTALPVANFQLQVQGRQVSVRATSVVMEAAGGPALLAIFVDDTDRLAAEVAVRRSEALLSHLVATSPDLITLTDLASGRYAMVNHSFERLTGWTAAEAVGRTSLELGVWATAAERAAFVALLRDKGSVTDLPQRFATKGGGEVNLVMSASRFVMEQREYLVINARDVTERERQRLEREAILNNASIGIAVTRDRHFVLANRHFEQIYGWGPGELVGQPGEAVWGSAADYADVSRLAGPVLATGEPVELERAGRRRDGSTFLAHVRGRAIDPQRPLDSGTIWIAEDVTERRQFEQALARARDDAEAANRAKSAFLANTSHELRTPLNGMIGLARMARDEHTDETRRRQYLEQIVESAQSLAGIISDILDLSKIEAGKLTIDTSTFDLGALLQTLQRTYATLAGAHGLVLEFEVAPDIGGPVQGDPLRLRQILSNYLSNAIKFTPRGGVSLRARRIEGGPRVRLEVRDSGPGIDAAVHARLFKPFVQADQSTTRRFGGTGLGLSICRELATLMGGSVGLDSRPGEGSTFWAELPLPAGTAAPASPKPADSGSLAGTRVLMAEDNPVNMMIAVAMLERWGVTVVQAADGRDAVAAVQRAAKAGTPFDAVLMDVQMPVMSGHEATRTLRETGHRLPVIALTAAALVTEREAALQAGMDDFLTKPIDADKLQAALQRWCASARNVTAGAA